jgi:hypothetical protein
MTTMEGIGIDVSGRVIVLADLEADLEAGGVPVPHGLTIAAPPSEPIFPPPLPGAPPPPCPAGSKLFTYDDDGNPTDLPAAADPIVGAYSASGGTPSGDLLAGVKGVPLGSTTDELRDRLVESLELKFGPRG